MNTTKRNLVPLELIGSEAEITKSKNKSLVGIKGKIIDETKNTIKIKTKNQEKMILKNHVTIKIDGNEIKGEKLLGRPEDRIKK